MTRKILLSSIKTVCFFILFQNLMFAQTKIGVSIEFIGYNAQIENNFLDQTRSTESSLDYDVCLSVPITFGIGGDISFSFRPGFVFGSLYQGPDIGLIGIYDLSSDVYLCAGINEHLNTYLSGGHSKHGKSVSIPYAVLGLGYKLSNSISTEMQINYSLNYADYGYWRRPTEYSSTYDSYYKTRWMIKLNFSYTWEL